MKNSRRDIILTAATAAAAFGVARRMAKPSAARADTATSQGFRRFNVGDVEVTTIVDGFAERPHDPKFITNATVEETKSALRAAGLDDSKIVIPFTVTLVKIGGRTIMFDSGTGGQLAPTAGRLPEHMKAAGIDPKSISTIIVTHYHSDHIFGLMEKDTNAQTYPWAEIVVPAVEHRFWTDPNVFSALPADRHALARRIQETLGVWKNVRQIEGAAEAVPGVRAVPAYGHTPGHTAYEISSGGKLFINIADLTNIPALFARHPYWHAAFDMDADLAEASRRKLFDRVVAEKATIAGYHYGAPGAGSILKDGDGYRFEPLA